MVLEVADSVKVTVESECGTPGDGGSELELARACSSSKRRAGEMSRANVRTRSGLA